MRGLVVRFLDKSNGVLSEKRTRNVKYGLENTGK